MHNDNICTIFVFNLNTFPFTHIQTIFFFTTIIKQSTNQPLFHLVDSDYFIIVGTAKGKKKRMKRDNISVKYKFSSVRINMEIAFILSVFIYIYQ